MKSDLARQYGLDPDRIPRHVAVIMDGNGRWAKKKLMNRVKGHEKGSETVRAIVSAAREIGVEVLTLYAFSTENWARPDSEVKALMGLLKRFIIGERQELAKQNIRLGMLGQKYRLPDDVRQELDITLDLTRSNTAMVLNLALSYGGREEIVRASRNLAQRVLRGEMALEDITEQSLSACLYTGDLPDPDLLIRTSGEMRLSNFLLWQVAYAELFVTDTLWPDFSKQEFFDILKAYQFRDRRFGKVACTSNDGSQP
ncbi:MAG: isoprenyl transferase [Pseudomonadota bacterium]